MQGKKIGKFNATLEEFKVMCVKSMVCCPKNKKSKAFNLACWYNIVSVSRGASRSLQISKDVMKPAFSLLSLFLFMVAP